jgi:hypothetical protein
MKQAAADELRDRACTLPTEAQDAARFRLRHPLAIPIWHVRTLPGNAPASESSPRDTSRRRGSLFAHTFERWEVSVAGGIGGKDDSFRRETLAERVANTHARQAGLGHGTSGFHGTPPNASSAWTSTPATPPASPSAPSASASSLAARRPAPGPAEPVRPCWFDSPWGRQPALLLQWRRAADGSYSGLVVVAAPDETGEGWTVIRLWAAASLLTPH